MLAVLIAAVNLFAQTFAGTWTCHVSVPATSDHPSRSFTSEWSIQSAPGDKWAVVRWGPQDSGNGGVAYVGYVPTENDWAYQDFHYDGSYGVTTSAGPDKDGVWTWAGGGYYTTGGILHGEIKWKPTSSTRIDRTYYKLDNGSPTQTGSDYCTKQ